MTEPMNEMLVFRVTRRSCLEKGVPNSVRKASVHSPHSSGLHHHRLSGAQLCKAFCGPLTITHFCLHHPKLRVAENSILPTYCAEG